MYHTRMCAVVATHTPVRDNVLGVAALLLGGSGLGLHRGGRALRSLVGGLACLHLPAAAAGKNGK